MKVIPKAKRLKAYKYALTQINKEIYYTLGFSVYGSFMNSPFTLWAECVDYFPELQGIEYPEYGSTPEQRKQILTKAIELCTPSQSH